MYKKGSGICVESVYKTYSFYVRKNIFRREKKEEEAVKDISFEVKAGEILGIVGPNGAGKTTLIKLVSGVMKATDGKILINGEDPFLRSLEYRKDVSIILGQKGKLHPDMTIYESAELYGAMYGYTREFARMRIEDITSKMLLPKEYLLKQVRTLSLGQRMKGEIGIALINNPGIIFLDEPTLGLDSKSAKGIREYLVDYVNKYKASVILTSHDIRDIQQTCNKLMIIKKGYCVFLGDIQMLPEKFRKNTVIECDIEGMNIKNLKYENLIVHNNKIKIECYENDVEGIVNKLYRNGNVKNLQVKSKDFEEMIEEILDNEE